MTGNRRIVRVGRCWPRVASGQRPDNPQSQSRRFWHGRTGSLSAPVSPPACSATYGVEQAGAVVVCVFAPFRGMDANAASVTASVPRRDLLNQPRIAIGILEGEERPVARALGIRAAEPRLHGERRAMPHPTCVYATADEFGMGSCDVGNDQRTDGRARRGRSYSLAERDRARGARGRELDDANVLGRGVIGVEPPTQATVKLLGSFDVGHGNDVDLELHVDLF